MFTLSMVVLFVVMFIILLLMIWTTYKININIINKKSSLLWFKINQNDLLEAQMMNEEEELAGRLMKRVEPCFTMQLLNDHKNDDDDEMLMKQKKLMRITNLNQSNSNHYFILNNLNFTLSSLQGDWYMNAYNHKYNYSKHFIKMSIRFILNNSNSNKLNSDNNKIIIYQKFQYNNNNNNNNNIRMQLFRPNPQRFPYMFYNIIQSNWLLNNNNNKSSIDRQQIVLMVACVPDRFMTIYQPDNTGYNSHTIDWAIFVRKKITFPLLNKNKKKNISLLSYILNNEEINLINKRYKCLMSVR